MLPFSRGEKSINQRKNLPVECAQGDEPERCPNRDFCVNQPSTVPWWWRFGGGWLCFRGVSDVMCGDVVRDVMWLAAR